MSYGVCCLVTIGIAVDPDLNPVSASAGAESARLPSGGGYHSQNSTIKTGKVIRETPSRHSRGYGSQAQHHPLFHYADADVAENLISIAPHDGS
jgi:hypothetical protein